MNRDNLKKIKIIVFILLMLMLMVSTICMDIKSNNGKQKINSSKMTYSEVVEGENSTETEYVKFDAYFLKSEGENAKKVRGSAKELNETEELYIELNVLTNGHLENGKIILESGNYEIARTIDADNEISYVSNKTINLKEIPNGTYKTIPVLIEQNVISMGNFTANKQNLSKENVIKFTGTHVAEDGTRTEIDKTVKFNLDWYGNKNLERMESKLKTYIADKENNKVIIAFQTEMYAQSPNANELQLPDKAAVLDGVMPLLNGYAPINVNVIDVSNTKKNLTYNYNTSTRRLEIRDEIIYNEEKAEISVYDERYKIKVMLEYPYEAYSSISATTISMNIKVSGYLEGYNNPNSEYVNPLKSEAGTQIVNVNLKNPQGKEIIYEADLDLLSKANLRLMYDRNVNTNNGYRVTWRGIVNLEDKIESLIFSEDYTNSLESATSSYNYNVDQIQDATGNFYSLDGISEYIGVKVPYSSFNTLGENGYIKIIDADTQNVIKTITKDDVDKYISYDKRYSHIRIETSKPLAAGNVEIYNYKNIDNDKFVKAYTKEQFNNMDKVYTSLNGNVIKNGNKEQINGDVKSVDYEEGNTIMRANTVMQLNKQTNNNALLTIDLISSGVESDRNITEWVNPTIIVEYPEEIENISVDKITSTDGEIVVKETKIEKINGKKVLKIVTEGTTVNGSNLNIKHSITMKSDTAKSTGELRIFAYNQLCDNWNYVYNNTKEAEDIYDINSNGDTTETRKITTVRLIYSKPTGLYTNTELTNYDSENSIVRGPDVASIDYNSVPSSATIKLNIFNNYSTPVTGVKILGKIPFDGNSYQINGKILGSNFTTTMSNKGIQLPSSIKTNATIYYSEQELVSNDLTDASNGWTTSPKDYSKVKTYLIDLSKITMTSGESYEISYDINLPDNLIPGNVAYATHAVYFEENTTSGIVNNSTETNKVGLKVISKKRYNVELTKYRAETTNPVENVVFEIGSMEDKQTYTTDSNGKLTIQNLYLETEYTIKEIRANSNYKLDETPITFKVTNQGGKMVPQVISGSFKDTPIMENETTDLGTMKVIVENEPKYQLNIVKTVKREDTKIEGTKFELQGDGVTASKVYETDSVGTTSIEGLLLDTEYTLNEIYTPNEYVLNSTPIVFKVERIGGKLQAKVVSGEAKQISIEENLPDAPILTLNIENEKKYDLKIVKNKIGTDYKVEGTTFNVKGEELPNTGSILTTTADGSAVLQGLVPEKIYTIQEIETTENYELNNDEIQIRAYYDDNNILQIEKVAGSPKNIEVENLKTAIVTVENEVKYNIKITKKKKDSEDKIAGVKFEVQGRDKENTIVETDSDGIATIDKLHLGETYTIKEIYAKGYYVDKTEKTITLKREHDTLVLENTGSYKTTPVIDETGVFTTVKFELENEEIPKYTLELTKLEEDTTEVLQGANFTIEGNGRELDEEINYTTSSEGKIIITNLYENEEYILKETLAPEGYTLNEEAVKFIVTKDSSNNLTFKLNSGNLKEDITIDQILKVVNVKMEDKPLFKLVKVDKDTQEPLVGAKFIIQRVDTNGNVIDYAKNPNGDYVGDLEGGKYVLRTNEKGIIACALEGGFYKATEIEAPNGYKLADNESDRITNFTIKGYEDIKINYIEDLVNVSLNAKKGTTYNGKLVTLERTLDFNDDASYKNPNDTSFGDYNEDGTVEGIKEELTKVGQKGFYPINNFYGVFNGKDNEIRNIYINNTTLNNAGLFQKVYGTVNSLGITGTITGNLYAGSIAGENEGTIKNCYNKGIISASYINAGGLVGSNNGMLTNCYNAGTISGDITKGGIAGSNAGTITNCYNIGNFSNSSTIGGIVGNNSRIIRNCYNAATITSTGGRAGGIVGINTNSNFNGVEYTGTIENCYNIGAITGYTEAGGIAGGNYVGEIIKSYNEGTVTATYYDANVGGISGYNEVVINNCYNSGAIIGKTYTGGITGGNEGTISNCYNTTTVKSNSDSYNSETFIGGITGLNNSKGKIIKSYNIGNITNTSEEVKIYTGGIAGKSEGTVTNCYNTGEITRTTTSSSTSSDKSYLGGIIGYNTGSVSISYNEGTVESDCYAGGIAAYSNNTIENCYNVGNINAEIPGDSIHTCYGAGIVAQNEGSVTNCYNTVSITSSECIGGIITKNEGTVTNCYNTGNITAVETGGIAYINTGTLKDCYNEGKIVGNYDAGGITVYNYKIIENCYNIAEIQTKNDKEYISVAGIASENGTNGTIKKSYNKGKITGAGNSGGLTGTNSGTIENCYNEAEIVGNKFAGGLCGNNTGTISNCYNTASVNATSTANYTYVGGIAGKNEGTIANTYNTGTINNKNGSTGNFLDFGTGGIVGDNCGIGNIINSYNGGSVNANDECGGIAGRTSGAVINCYNTGTIANEQTAKAGGIIGGTYSTSYDSGNTYYRGTITKCYYKTGSAGTGTGYGTGDVTAMSDTNMKAQSFVNTLNSNQSSITSPVALSTWVKTSSYPTMNIPVEKINAISINNINFENIDFEEIKIDKSQIGVIKNNSTIEDKLVTVTKITVENEAKQYANPAKVIVHHYLQGTTTNVADDEIIKGEVGDSYTTNEKILDKYIVVESSKPANASGTMAATDIEVVYEYVPRQSKIIIHHYKDSTTEKLVEDEEMTGNVGDTYTTNYKTDIEGYQVVTEKLPKNRNGEYTKDTIEIIYYYSAIPKGKVIVHHYAKDTNFSLVEDEIIENYVGTPYTTNQKNDIEGYEIVTKLLPTNANGTITENTIEVIYYYKLKQYNITTQVNGGHGNISGENETPYEIVEYGKESVKELKVEPQYGYKVKNITINGVNISFTEDENYIVYIDRFKNVTEDKHIIVTFERVTSAGVTVKYLEFGTDEELIPSEKLIGYVGEDYTTTRKEITNYETIGIEPDNATGKFTKEEQIVIYYYKKSQGQIIIKYVDQDTGAEIAEKVELNGNCGDSYNTKDYIKDIKNYSRVDRVTGNEEGKFEKKVQEIIYYYSKDHGKVIVKYVEKDTKKEISNREEINGNAGDAYDTTDLEKTINGYIRTADNPENKQGIINDDTIEVIYYYELATPTITNSIVKTATANKVVEQIIDNGDGTTKKVDMPVLTKEDGIITYNITYKVVIKDYIGKAAIEIKDTLPAEIDISKSNLAEGSYDALSNTITWTELVENIDTYTNGIYENTITKQIEISYINQDVISDLLNTVKGTVSVFYPADYVLKPGEERARKEAEDEAIVKQEYKVNIQVEKQWIDNNNLKNNRPDSVTITIKDSYSSDKIILLNESNNWKYELKDLQKYDEVTKAKIEYNITESETNKNDLEYYENAEITSTETQTDEVTTYLYNIKNEYKLLNTDLNAKITKEGTKELTASSQNVDYTIKFTASIADYIGKGKVTIVDYLPFAIDEEKSELNGGKYDELAKTITWEEELPHINTQVLGKNYEIAMEKQISILYKDINLTLTEIENKVKGQVQLYETDQKDEVEESYKTSINVKGKVIVKYVDKITNQDLERYEIEEKVGTVYNTDKKDFENYNFIESTANTSGTVIDGIIEVIYYYEKMDSSVLVKYEDIDNNKLAEDEVIVGKVGDKYTTVSKEIENYMLVSTTDNTEGNMTKEQIIVVYTYKKIPSKVIVKYLEIGTDKEIMYKENSEDETSKQKSYSYEINGYVGESYNTQEKEIPYYDLVAIPNNKDGVIIKDEITVIYYYKKQTFNISINKEIQKIILNGEEKQITNNKLVKLEIPESKLKDTSLQVKYKIILTNTEKIDGIVKIQDLIPSGFELAEDGQNVWTKDEKGKVTSQVELKAGEEKVLEISLNWNSSEENLGTKENTARIVWATNKANYAETTKEDNISSATIVISIKTGKENSKIIGIYATIIVLVILGWYIYDRKNKLLH